MAAAGEFRLDLLFRLRTFEIHLPPLRVRREDIQPLTVHYLNRICKRHGRKVKGMLPEFLEHLESWHWPGNVRELVNVLEAAILSDPENPMLFPLHLPHSIRTHFLRHQIEAAELEASPPMGPEDSAGERFPPLAGVHFPDPLPDFKTWRTEYLQTGEKSYLERLMASVKWDIPTALDVSRLSQSRLYYYLKKFDIPKTPPDS
jgi:two-component system NtrC family response regulator